VINKLVIAETENIDTTKINIQTMKRPCLEIFKDENSVLTPLEYANTNSTVIIMEDIIQVCATFPNRRAVFVLDIAVKSGSKVTHRMIEFYEYGEHIGWKFKKQYREQQE